ncbi:MAG: DUF5678 domain-containing protein [Victivallaceae bacterium]|nr:DUF5678 domain-containing protein [Victivallaceae bacterium]
MHETKKMKPHVLSVASKYHGTHVAFENFNSKRVVASGDDPALVIKIAKAKGFPDAALSYIPEKDAIFVY